MAYSHVDDNTNSSGFTCPAMGDSFHGATHSERSDDPSTESRMCTEESAERMTSSTEGMVSLSDDSSDDTHAEAHGVAGHVGSRKHDGTARRSTNNKSSCRVDPRASKSSAKGEASVQLDGEHSIMAAVIEEAGHSSGGNVMRDDIIEVDEESDEQGMKGLLGSYREISLEDDNRANEMEGRLELNKGSTDSVEAGGDTEEEVSNLSPDSVLPSPQYVDERVEQNVAAYFEDDEAVRAGDVEFLEIPNQRPNSLQLQSSTLNAGARPKRPTSSSSSGTSEGKWNRYQFNHQEASLVSRQDVDKKKAASTGATILSSSAPTFQPTSIGASAMPSTISSSPTSVSSSSDLEGMFGALQGLILRDGDMVSFVADDLQEQIRRSSPVARRGTTSFPGSRSSSPSLYKQAVTPQVMPIDPNIINDVEKEARAIASSVNTILENLTGTMHSISSLTVDCMESYQDSVFKTCDSMDANIKAMYQLMAKVEELGNMMKPVHRLSNQIKEIKRLLTLFEQVAGTGNS